MTAPMTRPDSHDPLAWAAPPPCDYLLPGYEDARRAHRRMIWRDRAQRWFRAGMIAGAGALIGALATLALTREAKAHDWYPMACCGGHDCAAVTEGTVGYDDQGRLTFALPAGSHPMLMDGYGGIFTVPESVEPQPSPDGRWHICLVYRDVGPNYGGSGDGSSELVPVCVWMPGAV